MYAKIIMQDYRFSDTEKMMSNKDFIITTAKNCSLMFVVVMIV